ncbi:MAG: fluoride efflux transporter CrcB [Proteobacteria bacterium]|nr:fluoride efflux transporter CrcB [Pseudomonadota bacterium]
MRVKLDAEFDLTSGDGVWKTYLWVALGSGLGGSARLLCSDLAARWLGMAFPWGTLSVNVVGSLLIGLIAAMVQSSGRFEVGPNVQHFLMVGVLGGYTTFSAFSFQILALVRDGDIGKAAGYVVLSLVLCLAAVTIGYAVGGAISVPQQS